MEYENSRRSILMQAYKTSYQIFFRGFKLRYQDPEAMLELLTIHDRITDEADMMSGCLRHSAFRSEKSRGRINRSRDNELVTQFLGVDPFDEDAAKIANSKAFRRLQDKTQVYTSSKNPYVRNRLSHTMEVESIAVSLAAMLGLNVSLVRAIARGHDIGHVPFGHEGERVIEKLSGKPFKHATFSTIVAQRIEHKGRGLNLCFETLQGITRHSLGKENPEATNGYPLEYILVAIADKLAYVFSDLNDALREKTISQRDIPRRMDVFGKNQRDRVMICQLAIVKEALVNGTVTFGDSYILKTFLELREWMFENVYIKLRQEELVRKFTQVCSYFGNSSVFSRHDPLLLASLLTNKEVFAISDLLDLEQNCHAKFMAYFHNIEFFELIKDLPRDNPFDFNQVDLEPAHYS